MAFRRHFRIYFKNNHPAYIVDEEGNMYVFHRTTHSKKSGKRNNWEKENPINDGDKRKMYIVKKEQKDNKGRFSLFTLDVKPGVDISYPEIKRAGSTQMNDHRAETQTSHSTGAAQTKHDYSKGRAWIPSGKPIKTKSRKKRKKKKKISEGANIHDD